MSQKATIRKSVPSEEKERRPIVVIDSSVKDMKKKVAANAEKEKQAAEKADKPAEKADKPAEKTDKPTEKTDKPAEKTDKPAEKISKPVEKNAEKPGDKKPERNGEKAGEKSDKKTDTKQAEKKETVTVAEKNEESKGEKSSKATEQKSSANTPKQNGSQKAHNGVSDVTLNANGATDDVLNGTVSEDEDDVILVIDDDDVQDDLFPELTYEESDADGFEPPARADSAGAPSRSLTRRSQVKTARTPETPRPLSDKQSDKDTNSDDSKVLKLKDDASGVTDRKLRSADSPKPESKKQEAPKKAPEKDSPKKTQEKDTPKDSEKEKENGESSENLEVHIIVELETEEEPRKTDTNYSKSRVKVSPYRRSTRLADQTASSLIANYTGNNTTMEMDITESSFASEEPSLDDSSFLNGLRSIRGRRSYKPLKEMSLRHTQVNRSMRSTASTSSNAMDAMSRPTGTVVGRKRKPDVESYGDTEPDVELAADASEADTGSAAYSKRLRLLERISQPFRRAHHHAPVTALRAHEIVGINTDLPLTVPLASPAVEPSALKPAGASIPIITVTPGTPDVDRDAKRCVVM